MSTSKWLSTGVVVGTKIYLFGGRSNSGAPLETAEVYDCETGTYSQYRSMPEPRDSLAAAVLNGHIYVAGGHDGSKALSSVFRYDIQTTRLETVSSMDVARHGHQLIELGGYLYAIGGYTDLKSVEKYDPKTDSWSEGSCTNYVQEYFGATAHEGKIYALSRYGFEVYDPHTDEWTILTYPSSANLRGTTLLSMNGKLWAVGGDDNENYIGKKSVMYYDTATNKWHERPDMNTGRVYHTAFVVNH